MPNNREICHLWASENRAEGKGSNLFFDGRVIFSYGRHFPIARLTADYVQAGEAPGPFRTMRACLFTSRGYSSTTAKHKCYTRQAVPDSFYIFTVPDVLADSPRAHAENLAHLVAEREALILKAARARNNAEWFLNEARAAAEAARLYAATYNLPAPNLAPVSPELLAAAKAKADKARKDETAAQKERARLAALDYADKVAAWRGGAGVSIPYRHDAPTMLRLIDKGQTIETSRGARVPVSVAAGLWQGAKDCRRQGHVLKVEAGRAAVGDYALREIRADGSLVIGCHVLEFAELERMAATLGLPAFKAAA